MEKEITINEEVQYNMDYYLRPETSNSDLNLYDSVGARRYKYTKENRDDKRDTKSMKKGRAIHNYMLQKDYFEYNYIPMSVKTPTSPPLECR